MREIKFRAWNKRRNEMVRFDLFNPLVRNWWEHVKETTMQYTGLKDCKGKEIYEGDIVEVRIDGMGTGHKHPVVWDNDDATYKFGHAMLGGSDVEIIGNIYENKELLESE